MNEAAKKNETMKKSIVRKITVVFFVLLLMLTFFSNTISYWSLPRVKAKSPVESTLAKEFRFEGTVVPKETLPVFVAPEHTVRVKEVKVRPGDRVKKGDLLLVLDEKELMERIKLEKAVFRLLNLPYDPKHNDSVSADVISPEDGFIREVYTVKDDRVSNVKPVCSLMVIKEGFFIKSQVDAGQASLLKPGDPIHVGIDALGGEPLEGRILEVRDSGIHPGEEKEVWTEFKAPESICGGERVELFTCKVTNGYEFVVPNSAVVPGKEPGRGFLRRLIVRKGFLGEEYRVVMLEVEIKDSDNKSTAVTGKILKKDLFVTVSSKPIKDGSKVKVEFEQ